jgi:arylsulfatase A-like enzyme
MSTFTTKHFLVAGLCSVAVGLTACTDNDNNAEASVPAVEKKKPNILFIMADDLGYSDLGAFGGEISTPNIDALASTGRILTDYHTAQACSPTRSQLLSGTDHHLAGIGSMAESINDHVRGADGYEGYLNDKVLSLPQILKDNGYHTYIAGKWHLGLTPQYGPKARGFERSFVLLQGYDLHYKDKPASVQRPGTYTEDGQAVELPDGFFSTNYYTDKLLDYLSSNKDDKPFFAYAAYTAPHWPLQAPDEFIAKYKGKYDAGYDAIRTQRLARQKQLGILPVDFQPAAPLATANTPGNAGSWNELTDDQKKIEARKMEVYAAMVENLDYNVGRIIAELKKNGQYDNTLIFFVSDNGAEGFPRNANGFDNSLDNIGKPSSYVSIGPRWAEVSSTPFHLWKLTAGEGAVLSPAIIKLPSQTKAENINTSFTSVKDVSPTILEIAQINNPGSQYNGKTVHPITGKSWLSLLQNKTSTVYGDNFVFADELHGNQYVRTANWKLALQAPYQGKHIFGTGDWELYDIKTDRAERNNVAAQHPDIVADLKAKYAQYAGQNGVKPFFGQQQPK